MQFKTVIRKTLNLLAFVMCVMSLEVTDFVLVWWKTMILSSGFLSLGVGFLWAGEVVAGGDPWPGKLRVLRYLRRGAIGFAAAAVIVGGASLIMCLALSLPATTSDIKIYVHPAWFLLISLVIFPVCLVFVRLTNRWSLEV